MTLAVQGFLRLIKYPRIVIIQDAYVLREMLPNDALFTLPIFSISALP